MKTAVITGGNSGIGKAIATALAAMEYRVIIHGRDDTKTRAAADEIREKTESRNVDYIVADVSTLKGMKHLADEIKKRTQVINVLVLSTGVILPKQIITEDGLEAGYAIQYMSRFVAVNLLTTELKKGEARIIMVGAPLMKGAKIFFDDIAMKKNFTMMKALAQEMLAAHLFVQEFARRNTDNGLTINIAHVGISRTSIMRHSNFFLRMLVSMFGSKPSSAAKNFIYLATDPGANFSGYFLTKPGKPRVKEKVNHNPAHALRLWEMSIEKMQSILG